MAIDLSVAFEVRAQRGGAVGPLVHERRRPREGVDQPGDAGGEAERPRKRERRRNREARRCAGGRHGQRAGVLVVREIERVVGGEPVARLKAHRAAERGVILSGEILAQPGVILQPVALGAQAGQPHRSDFAERGVERQHRAPRVVIAIADRALGVEFAELRLVRDDVDRAAGRVATVECSLRPAQHLDPLEIFGFEPAADGGADVDPIDVERDRRILGQRHVVLADAADEQPDGVGTAVEIVDEQVGNLSDEVANLGDLVVLELLLAERGDRDRHVDQLLLALLRGDDDVDAAGLVFLWRVLRQRRRG